MADRRLIVVDADISKRLATELRARGREATTLASFHLDRSLDPVVLRRLSERLTLPWVLVTGDDHMPSDHGDDIEKLAATIATVDRRRPEDWDLDPYRREVVHRWAHLIAEQPAGSVHRYSLSAHRKWTLPRR